RYEEALEEHREELRLLEGAGDRLGCAIAHRKIGERLAELERYPAALQHQEQHLELARALGDHTEQQRAWATLGRTHMFIGESSEEPGALDEAQRAFHTSLAIVEERLEGWVPRREVLEMKARLFLNLALVSDSRKEPEQRERYLRRSIFLAEQGGLQEDLYRAHFNRGSILLRDGDHGGALRSLSRARECARSLRDRALESESCASSARVFLALGDFAAARRSLRQALALGPRQPRHRHQVRADLRYATRMLRLLQALEGAGGDAAAALPLCEQLGDACSRRGDYGRALGFYQRQLALAQSLPLPPHALAPIHVSLATTFGDLGQPARALHHFRQELALRGGDPAEVGPGPMER
ncbi:tonsoku-like protein, partial [Pezoporus occidentalis]|uniref:tonsoku-like protein n=1 Tax=Pezoporus occidentalis TaxID=407982 RepID=UPI002F90EC79